MKPRRFLPVLSAALLVWAVPGHSQAPAKSHAAPGRRAAPSQPAATSQIRPARTAERQAATASILAQLKAFQKDDYDTAALYQSSALKQQLGSVDTFRTMMKQVYPEFANYKTVQFGTAHTDPSGQHLQIPVTLTGQDGVTVRALYLMVREGKAYRVEGVLGGARAPVQVSPGIGMDA